MGEGGGGGGGGIGTAVIVFFFYVCVVIFSALAPALGTTRGKEEVMPISFFFFYNRTPSNVLLDNFFFYFCYGIQIRHLEEKKVLFFSSFSSFSLALHRRRIPVFQRAWHSTRVFEAASKIKKGKLPYSKVRGKKGFSTEQWTSCIGA